MVNAHKLLLEFVAEFEELYYQRKTARLHYVRQSVHRLIHLGPETLRIGPNAIVNQSVMEQTIGNLGEEIQQPSKAFANLQQQGIWQCQINALKARAPSLNPAPSLSRGAYDLGEGFVLLCAVEDTGHYLLEAEANALCNFRTSQSTNASNDWLEQPKVARWAQLCLPNGQVAHSL